MEENRKMIEKMLIEFEGMTPEEIEEVRLIWISDLKSAAIGRDGLLETIANAVCDVAVKRAKGKVVNT